MNDDTLLTANVLSRFWAKVQKTDDELSCWLWTAFLNPDGYGHLRIGKINIQAHRLAWIIAYGFIPGELCVLHHCDVACCVRPSHLFLGTRLDNNEDRYIKGRSNIPAGSLNPNALLTESDVMTIRSSAEPKAVLALRYGVTPSVIKSVKGRQSWKHV